MHAAAHEPRVRRVIAQDILSDFTECYARPLGVPRSTFVKHATWLPDRLVNAVIAAARRHDLLADWGVREGMRVFGVATPRSCWTRSAGCAPTPSRRWWSRTCC
jgi:hypothetical protein